MKINHLIVGARDVKASAYFYTEFVGLDSTPDISFTGEGKTLRLGSVELLVLPFDEERLPNPGHFAIEVENATQFDRLFVRAQEMGLNPRSMPPRDSRPGEGKVVNSGGSFRIFYVFDPSETNVEIMVRE